MYICEKNLSKVLIRIPVEIANNEIFFQTDAAFVVVVQHGALFLKTKFNIGLRKRIVVELEISVKRFSHSVALLNSIRKVSQPREG